uniref:Sodium-dependent nutrient amino acid transporter 1 n=1 Tax=Glossina pallidipes TaxID=7398 RepID=A0A1B0ADB1_GLOPL
MVIGQFSRRGGVKIYDLCPAYERVCFGAIIIYAPYNKFDHNVNRDAIFIVMQIITGLDTFTSLLAGCTIFGIIGHLTHEIGDDNANMGKGDAGLASISYREPKTGWNSKTD